MTRFIALALLSVIVIVGCGKEKPRTAEEEAETRKAVTQYARDKFPVLDRTLVEADLKNIHMFLSASRDPATGRWHKDMAAAKEMMQRDGDMRKLYAQVEDGTYVIVGNPQDGAIVAYCTKETTMGTVAVSTSREMSYHKKDDLQKLLTQQKR